MQHENLPPRSATTFASDIGGALSTLARKPFMGHFSGPAAVLTIAATVATSPAQAATIDLYPGDVYSNVPAISGVNGDGTLGNDSWHVTTGPANVDFFYLADPLGISNAGITIRDISRVSFDVKHNGGYSDPTFSMQIETDSPYHPDGFQAIDFFHNIRDDTNVDDSADFQVGEWNTYEWNKTGDAPTGLEGTLHQNESPAGSTNGGNGQNNPWYTFEETLYWDEVFQNDGDPTNDDYYRWLDDPIDGLKITALDGDDMEFEGWLDNFTFTYDTGDGSQQAVANFAAYAVDVAEPGPLGMALFGIALLGMGVGARRYRA